MLPKKGPGRPKGSVNKLTGDIRAMIEEALEKAGGAKYLEKQAKENPGPFLALVGKCLPKDVLVRITNHVSEMSDAELERLATASSARVAQTARSQKKLGEVH